MLSFAQNMIEKYRLFICFYKNIFRSIKVFDTYKLKLIAIKNNF